MSGNFYIYWAYEREIVKVFPSLIFWGSGLDRLILKWKGQGVEVGTLGSYAVLQPWPDLLGPAHNPAGPAQPF